MRKQKRHPYYNYARLWSHNAVYNFLVGGRGLGKTYGAKRAAIKANIEKGDEFVYLRRYKTELQTARDTFFADIAHVFPDWDFRLNGMRAEKAPAETRDERKRPWTTVGYFAALSTAQTQKSVAFPKVTLIIFDEFILEDGALSYIRNEATVFNNFYSTVDRNQDKTRVLFLANSVSIMNPYFIEYEIRPDQSGEFWIGYDGFILCHFPDSKKFASSVYETRFGKFIQNTEYAEYAIGNQFEDAHEELIGNKTPHARYEYTLETKHGTVSIWYDMRVAKYFIQSKRPGQERIYTLLPEKMSDEKLLLTFSDKLLTYLRTAFRTGNAIFDKPSTRNAFVEVFKR